MKNTSKFTLILLACISFFSGCVTHKNLLSLQNNQSDSIFIHQHNPYLVRKGDILDIQISSVDPLSVAIFNKDIGTSTTNQVSPASLYLNGYSVNDSGSISLGLIGELHVEGLQISQIKDSIKAKLEPYYKTFSVDVKITSFRVTLLGEVNSQGTYYVYNNHLNILQVIGMGGGFTDLGNRKKVRILRQTKGISQVAYLNLNNVDIVSSPYFYLQPDDVIYVEPMKAKVVRVNAPTLTFIVSSLTLIFVLLKFINGK